MPDNSGLIQQLLQRFIGPKTEEPIGLPTKTFSNGDITMGGLFNRLAREGARRGLPGDTPAIDPRFVNPTNDPRMSAQGLWAGDLRLPPEKHGISFDAYTDPGPAAAYEAALKKQGY